MIIYKRMITHEDVANMDNDEKLIYYKSDNIAITINQYDDRYIVREIQISDNKLIDEAPLNTVGEVMDFIETV